MKTHELAKALNHLSRILRAGPNTELENLVNLTTHVETHKPPKGKDASDRGAALALLAQMASYSKQELIELANALNIPIEIRSADAVRDVLGKILKYLQENPGVQQRLVQSANEKRGDASSPLARALAILMSQQ